MRLPKYICLFIIIFLYACQSPTNVPTTSSGPMSTPAAYPLADSIATPILELRGKNFKLNAAPAGSMNVSGEGPSGLNIQIVDVTLMGKVLTSTQITDEGTFTANLPAPLEANHVIGIQLPTDALIRKDLLDTIQKMGGERYRIYPQVGIVYDSLVVR